MKALLMKDCYTLWKQVRIYLLVMLAISVFNGDFGNIFIVIWAALLPYTAMAYDERSKWDQMAAMMPYSIRDIVLGKYVLGWLCTGVATLFALVSQCLQTVLGSPLAAFSPTDNEFHGIPPFVLYMYSIYSMHGLSRGNLKFLFWPLLGNGRKL